MQTFSKFNTPSRYRLSLFVECRLRAIGRGIRIKIKIKIKKEIGMGIGREGSGQDERGAFIGWR